MVTITSVLRGAVAAAALLSLQQAAAQADLALRELPAGRGLVALGEGGLTATPPVQPIAGQLGAATAWVDLNDDGYDDFVFGAPTLPAFPASGNLDDAGRVYVVFGDPLASNPSMGPDLDLTALTSGQALSLVGAIGDRAGSALASAGDVDGDGIQDLIIGAPGANGPGRPDAGAAYVFFGAADLDTLALTQSLPALTAGSRAVKLLGARSFGTAGSAVGGGVDVDDDGSDDLVLGAPLDSTNSKLQNGTATIVYGDPSLPGTTTLDLLGAGAGTVTVVHGSEDFQLLGTGVTGLGNYDPVLPDAGGAENLTAGDDVALGAPGTVVDGKLFAGAVYVVRGSDAGVLPASYVSDDFTGGTGPGLVFTGRSAGDQTGSWVGTAGDFVGVGDGFVELLAAAPFSDGPGKTDSGTLYLLPGRLGGANPTGYPLTDLGVSGNVGLAILGASTGFGTRGIRGCNAGDFDGDGTLDLAVGFPNATSVVGPFPMAAAGTVQILDGAFLQPPAMTTFDLAILSGLAEIQRVSGETAGAYAGQSVAVGDQNGDGFLDLSVGAPGAPSDPNPLDPTGLAFLETGRGHVLFGPLTRISDISPTESWFDGPIVDLTVLNLSDPAPTVVIDGLVADVAAVFPGSPGTIRVNPPAIAVPGSTVDVSVTAGGTTTEVFGGLVLKALSVTTGPVPDQIVVGTEVDFTGEAFSGPLDLLVTFDGVTAAILDVDPLAGTLTVEAPSGTAELVPVDVVFTSSNGNQTLAGSVTYREFIVPAIAPITGPQTSGVFFEMSPVFPTITFEGQPAIPVDIDFDPGVPADLVVEFGSTELGWKKATQTGTSGNTLTVDLPYFLLGPQDTLVDVRFTTPLDQVVLEDAFTYEFSDFVENLDTWSPSQFAEEGPKLGAAGEFIPDGTTLLLLDNMPPETQFAGLFIGIAPLEPELPFKGGLLGVQPLVTIIVPILGLVQTLPSQLNLMPNLNPEGESFYFQLVTQEVSGPITDYGHSAALRAIIRFP